MSTTDSDLNSATDHGSPTIIDILRKRALHQGNQSAYTFLVDGRTETEDLTYEELDRRSRAIAASLQLAGGAGERVLLLYPHGLDFVTAFLGCLYAGVIAAPAYPPRLNRSQLRLQKIIEDTRATMALTTKAALARTERIFRESSYAKNLRWLVTDDMPSGIEGEWQEPEVNGDTLAMIQYTSGSTSAPKGVMVNHHNLLSNQRMIQRAFRQTERSIIVGWLPLYHDMGLIGNVLQPLFLGARCVLMSPTLFLQKPSRWLQAISDYRATTSGGPNFAYDLCVRKVNPDERAQLDLSSWTVAFNGSEPVFRETMERFATTFAGCGFRREAFFPCYGLAEATLLVAAGRDKSQSGIEERMAESDHSRPTGMRDTQRERVSCGKILPNERVVIVDPESLTLCPAESVGEIWISGPHVARGYWNQPQETKQTFGAYLRESGEGPFLRTGDLGYIKDDELFVAGRIKDLIIIRGRNHYPLDIELTIQQSDPMLESGACAAFSIEEADEELLVIIKELSHRVERPHFIVEGILEAVAREHEVQAHAIVLINMGSMPKTTSGKIQRYECRNRYLQGKLDPIIEWRRNITSDMEPENIHGSGKPVAIDTIENSLLSFLAANLRCDIEYLRVDKPLIKLGVDSLTAIELSHHLESKLGLVIPAVSLLEDVTIAQLAQRARGRFKGAIYHSPLSAALVPKEKTEHPLSYGQRSLWFLSQLAPLSGAYNVSSALRIRSTLDTRALGCALQKIADRHDSLRTSFLSCDGEPLQRIHEKSEISLLETDASSWSDESLDNYLAEEALRPFNLEQGPLLRVSLLTRSPQDRILLFVAHHIAVDLWSMGALIHELGLYYRAEMDLAEARPDPLPVRYIDYVYWQRELLAGQEAERLWSYWRSQLAGDLGSLDTLADRPRPPLQTFMGDSQPICLSMDLTQSLKSLGQGHNATLYMTLQAVFQALLHRYTAQEDIIIGSPMAGRGAAELAGLIGYFVNPVVLRTSISSNTTFSELLERVREVTLGALAHQDYPFALLIERLQPEHDPSRSPLFQVMFGLQKAPSLGEGRLASQAIIEGAQLNFGGLSAESVALRRRTSRFDLSLSVVETEEGLKGVIEYNTDLFDKWKAQSLADHLRTLAEAATANPERRIQELDLLNEREKQQIIIDWNNTEREYPPDLAVYMLIAEQAILRPESIAVIYRDEWLSYLELERRANQLANYLRALGVGPDCVAGLYLERSTEMVIGLLGILKAGAAYMPLEAGQPIERLRVILEDSSAAAALIRREPTGSLPGDWPGAVILDRDWEKIAGYSCLAPKVIGNPRNLAYVIYTSGSTGKPKGVMVEHSSIVNLMQGLKDTVYGREVEELTVSLNASIAFDASVKQLIQLSRGHRLCIVPEQERLDGGALVEYIRSNEIDVLDCTPSQLETLIAAGLERGEIAPKIVLVGGENIGERSWDEMGASERVKYYNVYGPTECTVDATVCLVIKGESPSIGRPIANTKLYILDREMKPVPIGVRGDLYISGAGLARGYRGKPELTAERFIPNPFGRHRGERLYRTGDVCRYLANGKIEFVERADDQVKVRGYRVELGEIKAALDECREVKQSVVLARKNERGETGLVGYVVREGRATALELKQYLAARLPAYMIPEAILMLESMPLTANGKLDRKKLPPVKDGDWQIEQKYASLRTPVEEVVAGIFEEALKLDRVGREDNFFEIGGHSLLATQVVSRVRSRFGIEIGVGSVFESPTVEGLGRKINEAIRAGEKNEAPPLMRAEREGRKKGGGPLSFAQQRLWFLDQLTPNDSSYNLPGTVRLEGKLDLEVLERVINEIIRRHEALRTTFEVVAAEPVQLIGEWEPRKLEVIDLTAVSPEEREEEVLRIAREEAETGFDLSRGPLLRVRALELEEERRVLLFTMHHIVSDEWSTGILVREIGALYQSYRMGAPSPLKELPIQYADFAVWQRKWLQGSVLEAELEYWREQLAGIEVLELPVDHPRPAVRSYRGARRRFVVERELAEGLRALSQRAGVTLFMTLLGSLDILMSRYSGQKDIVLGTDIANRNRAEIEDLIGFFVNQLVLRVEVKAGESFRELLNRVRAVCLGAYAHQDLPFEKLVEELQPGRDLGQSPLFQVKLILQNALREELDLGEARGSIDGDESRAESEWRMAKFNLTISIRDLTMGGAHGLVGEVEYSRDLFEGETIERLINHYTNILRGVVSGDLRKESEALISELSLLNEAEREQIVVEWNDTGRFYPNSRSIHELIAEQAIQRPERIGVKYEQEQISYQELNQRSNQLAHYLRELGVGPEVRVGVCLERSIEMVVGLLGILKAGGTYVPMDPNYPDERLKMMIEDAEMRLLLTVERLAERCSDRDVGLICLDRDRRTISTRSSEEVRAQIEPDNAAYVIYTSGSTGRPKGVIVTHRSLHHLFNAVDENLHLSQDDVWTAFHSYSFDFSVWEIWGALIHGGTSVVAPYLIARASGEFYELVCRENVTILSQTPSAFRHFMKADEEARSGGASSLRAVIFGGEALELSSLKGWIERYGEEAPQLINMYGITETTVHTTYKRVRSEDLKASSGSLIGRPMTNMRMYVLDEDLQAAPVGVVGELYVGGAGVARGYLGRGTLTAERFAPAPYGNELGERVYKTGDLVRYRRDGNIEYLGRRDHQVKIRGYRIELGEIEAALLQHEAISEAAVIAREEAGGDKRLVAYLVKGQGKRLTISEVKEYLRQRLPDYMAPAALAILETMPQTPNGKLDRNALLRSAWETEEDHADYVPPRTPVEEILVGLFEETLKLNRVGIRDNFFEIGGHSLLATQVISRARNAFEVDIGVRSIFEEATVEGVASRIQRAMMAGEKDAAPPLIRASRDGQGKRGLPLSFAQQRLWFLSQLAPNDPFYNILGAVRLEGRLDLRALESAINEVVRRHEILRTRIEIEEGEPAQVIDEWEPRRLEIADLTSIPPEEREEEVRRTAKAEAGIGFDLSRGPLLRVKILKLEDAEHVALLTMHHIVCDAGSMEVLVREIGELYEAISEGNFSPLPELKIQYADYAYWQRHYLSGETLERHLQYWKKQLSGKLQLVELVCDHPRPLVPTYRGAAKTILLPDELCKSLRSLRKREEVTLFMVLLAAFKTLLYKYTAQEDIIVGTAVLNRDRAELEPLIGCFVNMIPLRTYLGGNPRFSELLKRVKEVALGAYAHQEMPFEKLVEEVQPERGLSQTPLFNIAFGVQNAPQDKVRLSKLKISPVAGGYESARLDLSLWIIEGAEALWARWTYSADLFQEERIVRMHGHFETLLSNIVARPDALLDKIEMLSEAERAQQDQKRIIHEKYNYNRFKSVEPRAVALSED